MLTFTEVVTGLGEMHISMGTFFLVLSLYFGKFVCVRKFISVIMCCCSSYELVVLIVEF